MPDFVIPEFHVNAIDTPLVAPRPNAVEIRPEVAVSAMPVPEERLRAMDIRRVTRKTFY